MESIHGIIDWLVHFVHEFGYGGIFIMAFLESTFVPIPSEVTMVPAGYLVQQGKMNFWIVFFASTVGALGGSLANYFIAYHYGRRFLYKFGKYMFFDHEKMEKLGEGTYGVVYKARDTETNEVRVAEPLRVAALDCRA
ncbi:MAG: hypothetical protein EBV03_13620, partial [Proteobacteria bacterium]|nr:hypothetical protein [Pseudomonadota bacterium]